MAFMQSFTTASLQNNRKQAGTTKEFSLKREERSEAFLIEYLQEDSMREAFFMADILVALDAGHGGANPGAVYDGRKESEDALNLVLAIGPILEANGIQVYYTRTEDVFETPYQKAQEANAVGADYFVSIHRNSSPYPNQYSGVESLVYNRYSRAAVLAFHINEQLEEVGFVNLGVNERPNLIVLNSTQMPAVLVEVGFINTEADNLLFDSAFDEIAAAIAEGIIQTVNQG